MLIYLHLLVFLSSTKDHVEKILDGLPSDYESFVTSVNLRNVDLSLMVHESRAEKNNSSLDSFPSIYVASSNIGDKRIISSRTIMLLTLKVALRLQWWF